MKDYDVVVVGGGAAGLHAPARRRRLGRSSSLCCGRDHLDLDVVNPTVRELLELQYEFREPFIVDSTKIAAKLDVHATPLDQALADTLASYPTKPS